MGKLGKKARKFAKKNLQSVLRQRRKKKAFLSKRKSHSKNDEGVAEDQLGNVVENSTGRHNDAEDVGDTSLDAVFRKDDSDAFADISDSDGYLSEESGCPHISQSPMINLLEDARGTRPMSVQNKKIRQDLIVQKKKLDRLRKKDPDFSMFLQSYRNEEKSQNEYVLSDEDEDENENDTAEVKGKFLTSSAIMSWSQLVKEENSVPALTSLLNAYRAACHFGAESSGPQIQNSETFCSILIFVLSEADNVFRSHLQISDINCKKETLIELKNTSKWKNLRPLVKSYFRSSLFLLNQVLDSDILVFALNQLKASLIFFTFFPSLLHRLIKTTVNLWATDGEGLSSTSFLVIRDLAAIFSDDYLDTCIAKTFIAYMAQSRVSETSNMRHTQYLSNGVLEICSLNVQKSSAKAQASISQLSRILQWAMRTKKKEALKMVCSWEFANCIDLWVKFIMVNIRDCDLQPLLFRIIWLINGVACMFTGPRYIPIRIKCIHWLNNLSTSSGFFVPVASYVLDVLEYKITKEGGKLETAIDFSTILKLPKNCLRSQAFQEECLLSAIEQLSIHFDQWSYHISFPELATIPLIRLRKFHETTSNEGLRRMVKRFIDQVENNLDFVQKRRDEVAFSPNDHQSVELFLQLEKSGKDAPFTQYYRSIVEKAAVRTLHKKGKISLPKQKLSKLKRGQFTENSVNESFSKDLAVDSNTDGSAISERKLKRARKGQKPKHKRE